MGVHKLKRGRKDYTYSPKKLEAIEAKRKAGLITQAEAAALMGVCRDTYRKWTRQLLKEDSETKST